MTWIIGGNTVSGYCYAFSDIQVSWGNGFSLDCLQKFYQLSDNIGAGFAGSVSLGFKMLNNLSEFIRKERGRSNPEYLIK